MENYIPKQIVEVTNVDDEGNITGIHYPQTVPAAVIGLSKVILAECKEYIQVFKLSVSGGGSQEIILPPIDGYIPFQMISMSGKKYGCIDISKESDNYIATIRNVIEVGENVLYKILYISE